MQPGWKARAVTWLFLAESVRANKRAYPELPTAWLPHGLFNSLLLWLPELLRTLDVTVDLKTQSKRNRAASGIYGAIRTLCVDNRSWGLYVAPFAIGYAVSHPRFNIYKGELAARRFLGFGLDAIPHAVTGYALTHLFQDGIVALEDNFHDDATFAALVRVAAQHPSLFSALMLALMSTIWETGEYLMQQDELRRAGGDRTSINMEWDLEDTLFDLLSNAFGWLVADSQQRDRRT